MIFARVGICLCFFAGNPKGIRREPAHLRVSSLESAGKAGSFGGKLAHIPRDLALFQPAQSLPHDFVPICPELLFLLCFKVLPFELKQPKNPILSTRAYAVVRWLCVVIFIWVVNKNRMRVLFAMQGFEETHIGSCPLSL